MMKKTFALLVMVCIMLATGPALALTEFEWNLRCGYKLNSDATVFDCYVEEGIASGTDIPTQTYRFEARGNLPAGTYVGIASGEINGKTEIMYYSNGSKLYGYVGSGCISTAYVTVKASNGEKYAVPEVCYANPDTWYMVLSEKFGDSHARILVDALKYGTGSGDSGSSSDGYTAPKVQTGAVTWVDENGEEQPVTLVTLGTAVSVVKYNKEELTVPTTDLRWETTAEADEMLAVIKAHKTGEASLRVKASSKSTCIEKIDTNRIVLVLEKGKSFSKVMHEGKIGYIINTALTFYPVGGVREGDAEPMPGWVSFRGKIKSRNTINIRQNGKNGSRILTDFIAGTPIMVFNQEGKWSEIDVGGYRAFILTEYVTLDDGTIETE